MFVHDLEQEEHTEAPVTPAVLYKYNLSKLHTSPVNKEERNKQVRQIRRLKVDVGTFE